MSQIRVVALLPMKAHSERVARKNFRDFCGKPLFRWMLDTLLRVPEIGKVVINTDARTELARAGLEESPRVEIRDRAAQLCGDFVSMNRIIEDDVAAIAADAYVMTHTTNPLLRAETVSAAIAAFLAARKDESADSLFTVNRFQGRFYREDGSPLNHDPENLVRTQDLEPWFEENSNLYVFTRESFGRTRARIGAQPLFFETARSESVDIDDAASWRVAELLALGMRAAGRGGP